MTPHERHLSGWAALEQQTQALRNQEQNAQVEQDLTSRIALSMLSQAERLAKTGDSTVVLVRAMHRFTGYVEHSLHWEIDQTVTSPHIPLKQLAVGIRTDDAGEEGFFDLSYSGQHINLSTDDMQVFEKLAQLPGFKEMSPEDKIQTLVDTSVSITRTREQLPQMQQGERQSYENGQIIVDRIF